MHNRKLCPICTARPVAVNYKRHGITYYRSLCTACIRKGKKLKQNPPVWFRAGYRKKDVCEKCGFKAKFKEDQLRVFYVDGNLRNNDFYNLKTICLNCQQEIYKMKINWKPSPVVPDF